MSKPIQPHNHIVKCFGFILLFVFISLGTIGGCNNNNDGNSEPEATALTENDFANDSGLRAGAAEGVIATLLEHPDTVDPENDTGGVGTDRIPVTYTQMTRQTFCWEDDDPDAMHFMELLDSEDNVVMTVEANGDCVVQMITPGEYVMSYTHDGRSERAFAIFSDLIVLNPEQVRNTDGLIDKIRTVAVNLLNGVQNTVVEDANAQVPLFENLIRLKHTNSCVGCDLTGASLAFWDLEGADLTDANLTDASFERANLTNANFTDANMTDVDLDESTFIGANLTRALLQEASGFFVNAENADFTDARIIFMEIEAGIFKGANFTGATLGLSYLVGANFTNANLEMANLFGSDFRFANFTDADLIRSDLNSANLQGATLTGANFSRADWCNNCRCDFESIGTCVGCAPVEEACTGN